MKPPSIEEQNLKIHTACVSTFLKTHCTGYKISRVLIDRKFYPGGIEYPIWPDKILGDEMYGGRSVSKLLRGAVAQLGCTVVSFGYRVF